MIFQSLRKHQTTRRNIRQFKSLFWGLCCLAILSAPINGLQADDGKGLLDSLKSRSPIKRWQKRVEASDAQNQEEQIPEENVNAKAQYPLILRPGNLGQRARITRVSQLNQDSESSDEVYSGKSIIKKPSELKKITEIEPYYDYFPGRAEGEDPCRYLCPRPNGAPCDEYAGDGFECPKEVKLSEVQYEGRHFGPAVYYWDASNIHYNPLYFEDFALERYGHTWPCYIQPFVSVGKFGIQLAGLPYQMSLHPVHEEVYPLGYYRPGECAPKKIYQIPLNAKAAAVEAGVVTGLIFAIP